MKSPLKLLLCSALVTVSSPALGEDGFIPLFDGSSLEGWSCAKGEGADDYGPFSINEEEKAIHVYAGQKQGSKQRNDCLVSKDSFSHYILKLEYKWLENRYQPRADWDRDAGLLYHVHGDLTKVWPHSLEMQIGESPGSKPHGKGKKGRFHTGDLFVLGGHLRVDVRRGKDGFDPGAPLKSGRHCPTALGVEKAPGEWNEMEIRVHGSSKATYLLNGEVVFELENFEQKQEGEYIPLVEGRIGLQAEWAEILYRNIRIKKLPAEDTDTKD